MGDPRVVSLAPSATATLIAMDAAETLVGITDHCDAPAPSVGGWLTPDLEAVSAREPDLVLTTDALQDRIRATLRDRGHEVVHLDPRTLPDVLASFERLGDAVGRPAAGRALRERAEARHEAVRAALAEGPRPTVYCEEWGEPPMAAGNWVPEAVEAAGGTYPFVEPGERSRRVDRETVEAAEPAHAVVHHCGRGDDVDPALLADRGWEFPAVEAGAIHVLEDSLLNQPSPRLLTGIETLACRLHPDAVIEIDRASLGEHPS